MSPLNRTRQTGEKNQVTVKKFNNNECVQVYIYIVYIGLSLQFDSWSFWEISSSTHLMIPLRICHSLFEQQMCPLCVCHLLYVSMSVVRLLQEYFIK